MAEKMTLEPCPFCGSAAKYMTKSSWTTISASEAQRSGMGVSEGSICHESHLVYCTNRPSCFAEMAGWSADAVAQLWNRRHITQPAQAVDVGAHERLRELVAFLIGNAPLDGCWFGEKHPEGKGRFWWRTQLSEAFRALGNAQADRPKYVPPKTCQCLTVQQRALCAARDKCGVIATQSTPPQPEE